MMQTMRLIFDHLKTQYLRNWHLILAVALLMGLILPWRLGFSDVGPVRMSLSFLSDEVVNSFKYVSQLEHFAGYTFPYMLDASFLVGIIGVALYILGSLAISISRVNQIDNKWTMFLKTTSLLGVLVVPFYMRLSGFNMSPNIGYLWTAVMIVMSAFMEWNAISK